MLTTKLGLKLSTFESAETFRLLGYFLNKRFVKSSILQVSAECASDSSYRPRAS